ncbi:MAG TPA: CoA transferase [Streptosporangiaceae bacterium]|jgi:crotonobetainyl-CoA:carnitine CoA-transferase CaiB-like acyl-CoA transferase
MDAALGGVRVLDLTTGTAGPLAAMLLGDFGADVVKVEAPGGDPGRARAGFAMANRNKRSRVLDPRTGDGRRRLDALLAGADICVTGTGSAALGLCAGDPERLTVRFPRLVHLHMPPYLEDTPWPGGAESNALLSAALGTSLRQSSFAGGPVDPVYPHFLYVQAVWGACAAVAALVERRRSGHGQRVTAGGAHGAMVAMPLQFLRTPGAAPTDTAVGAGGPSPLYSRYRCADGEWLFVAGLTAKFQRIALRVLGLDHLLDAAGTDGDLDRLLAPENRPALRTRIAEIFATRDCADWHRAFTAADCPTAPVATRDAWLDHPQVRAIGMAVTLDDPVHGPVTMPGNPIHLAATPAAITGPAPRPDDAGDVRWTPRPAPAGPAPRQAGPLAGYRVLDLGMVLAGPYTGTLLAELGADVVKVEIPSGDGWRERGLIYIRGQRGLAVDLRTDEGRDLFLRLVRGADVVIDNFRPGVLDRLGIAHDRLLEANPRLVALSITAFGAGGPMSDAPGFDPLLQAMSGIMAAQGGADEPVLLTMAVNDVTVAALTALAACVALAHRDRTGEGQSGWTSLAGAATFAQSEELVRLPGRPPAPQGGRDFRGPGPLDRFYRTADGWIRLYATGEADVRALEKLLGPPGEATEQELERYFAARTRRDAMAALIGAGVPAAPARPVAELPDDPQLRRWEAFHRLPRPGDTSLYATGRWAGFSRTPNDRVLLPPGVGEHTTEILRHLGLDGAAIAGLCERGVVRQGGPMVLRAFGAYR